MNTIGFANQFYTLWNVDTEPVYTCDSYGKYWLTGYNTHYFYIKNISTDIEKVKSLYPTLTIDEDLKGHTNSWERKSQEDLCPQIMKFGKYRGENIDDLIIKDFDYILWLINSNCNPNSKYAESSPIVIDYLNHIELKKAEEKKKKEKKFSKFLNKGEYTFISDKNLRLYDDKAYLSTDLDDEIFVSFIFSEFSPQSYHGYDFAYPIINGKAKRIKNKSVTIKFKLSDIDTHDIDCARFLDVTEITINK